MILYKFRPLFVLDIHVTEILEMENARYRDHKMTVNVVKAYFGLKEI